MELIKGKNYGGLFGAKKAVYQGGDKWYFEHIQTTEQAAIEATKKFEAAGIFALYDKCDGGFYVAFACEKPQATKIALAA